jgi:hypothetical protein
MQSMPLEDYPSQVGQQYRPQVLWTSFTPSATPTRQQSLPRRCTLQELVNHPLPIPSCPLYRLRHLWAEARAPSTGPSLPTLPSASCGDTNANSLPNTRAHAPLPASWLSHAQHRLPLAIARAPKTADATPPRALSTLTGARGAARRLQPLSPSPGGGRFVAAGFGQPPTKIEPGEGRGESNRVSPGRGGVECRQDRTLGLMWWWWWWGGGSMGGMG